MTGRSEPWTGYEIYEMPPGVHPTDVYEPGVFRGFANEAKANALRHGIMKHGKHIYYRIIGPITLDPLQPAEQPARFRDRHPKFLPGR